MFVVIYLTIQVLVPLRAVIRPGQDEFGWQMYSEKPREFSYEVFTKDGTTKVINRSDFQASRRPEISFEKFLPEHLCDEVAGAVSVSVTRIGTQWQKTHPCRP